MSDSKKEVLAIWRKFCGRLSTFLANVDLLALHICALELLPELAVRGSPGMVLAALSQL